VSRPQRAPRTGSGTPAPSSAEPAAPAGSRPPSPALTLDALGKKCPIPIIMLADRIGEVAVGQTIAVLADDPAAKTDLPAWCALKSHEFIGADTLPVPNSGRAPRTYWSFLVRRTY
jgi:tRNA 2-thiouridine synthesizing protein A